MTEADRDGETMSEAAQYTIGSEVSCSDGVCGELARVVVDPVARSLTHLVVEPGHDHEQGRLVPVELVASAAGQIRLRTTLAEFEALDAAVEREFMPPPDAPSWGYGSGQVLSLPYFGLGMGSQVDLGSYDAPQGHYISYDRVPLGEVQIRRGEHVEATDGPIGHVQGLVIHPADHHVTHFLLEEGHLWGKKVVAIPIGAVKEVAGAVKLTLTKAAVAELPPVELAKGD